MSLSRPSQSVVRSLALGLLSLSFCLATPGSAPLFAQTPAEAGDWGGFRGPHTSGSVAAGVLAEEPGLAVAWRRALGSGYSSVSVVGPRAVTMYSDGTHDWVAAYDTAAGDELWKQKLGDTYAGHDGSHTGPIATPLLADGRVYVLDAHGRLAAYRLADGEPVWATDLVADHDGVAPFYGFSSSPLLAAGTLVVEVAREEGTFLAGFDPATGERRWAAGEGTVAYQSPMVMTLNGRLQVVAASNENLAGLDPATGEVLWQVPHGGDRGATAAASLNPVPTDDGKLLLTHKDDSSSLVEVVFPADGAPELREVWSSKAFRGSYNVPVYQNGLFFGFSGRIFDAVDAATGEVLWRSRQPGDGFVSGVDGHLVVITKTGELALVAAEREAYREVARVQLFEDNAWSPPAFAGGKVYVRSMGEIAAVDTKSGAGAPAAAKPPAVAAEPPKAVADLLAALAAEEGDDAAAARERRVTSFLDEHGSVVTEGRKVAILYREDVQDVGLASDLTGDRHQEVLRRVDGTDLWVWTGEADEDARFSYKFVVDYDQWRTDPRNEWTVTMGMDDDMSSFAMPGWTEPVHLTELPADAPRGRIETIRIELAAAAGDDETDGADDTDEAGGEAAGPTSRTVDVYLPPGYDVGSRRYPVIYVHDGAEAREAGGLERALNHLVGRTVEPVVVAFVHVLSPMEMWVTEDYVAGFKTVVDAVDERFRTLPTADNRGSVGMGPTGFMAFATAFAHPDTFGNIGAQTMFMLDSHSAQLREQTPDPADRPLDIYLGWSRYELFSPVESWNMKTATRDFAEFLRSEGYRVESWEAPEGSGYVGWRSAAARMLEALFPARPVDGETASR